MIRTRHSIDGTTHKVHLGGWKKQATDTRDEEYRVKVPQGFTVAPASVDLRSTCSPVEDQGELGSCTANMMAGLVEANELRRAKGVQAPLLSAAGAQVTISNVTTLPDGSITYLTSVVPQAPVPAPTPPPAPTPAPTPPPAPASVLVNSSRLFTYYATRKIEGTVSEDSGATIRDTIKSGVTYGVADEKSWPYDISKFTNNPPATVWTQAATHKVTSYHAVSDGDLVSMKAVLASGYLVGFGFAVYDFFLSQEMATRAFLPLPKTGESLQGGHAVCLVGYDDNIVNPYNSASKGAFLVRNSWGTSWGLAGYFWMSYDYVKNTKLCSDFWVVQSKPIG